MAILAACGGDGGSDADAPNKVDVVSSIYSLGDCTSEFDGDTVFVKDEKADYVCLSGKWVNIDSTDSRIRENDEEGRKNDESSSSVIPGNDPDSSSSTVDDPLNGGSSSSVRASYIEVPTKEQLGTCDSGAIGLRALVLADSSYFTCKANGWAKDDTYLGYDIVPTKEDLPQCHAGNAKQRVLDKKDSVFFKCDSVKWVPETADGYIVKNASILGAAQKGPFKFDSPLTLREVLLHDDALTYTGREYIDEISSNKGDFVIPKVNLVYPYAVLEVRGLWRNEVSGEYSKDSMTLRVLTDLTGRTEVNINLLTHLEYDRAVKLVNKGYSVFAAKKQAEYEIMTAFGFATTVEYSEDLKTFVPSTCENYGENATLMAISLLFIGDRSEAEIQNAINSFKSDLAEDGEWDDGQMKADMADWAEGFDGGSVRANVKSWNILDIPAYENYLTIYWNNAYELGGCSATRSGVIAQNKNSKSKNYNVHYICKATSWQKATDYEKDTYQWAEGEEGEFKKGDVTETYYVFKNGSWTVAKNETALGLCTEARNGEIGKIDTTYFICKNKNWNKATVLEYDTYQFGPGEDGEVRTGKVNTDKFYVYENGAWRVSASEIENNLGACVTSREGEVGKSGSTYYICKSKSWTTATALEYDTYGWAAGTEGEVKAGSVNAKNYYVYEEGSWRASASEIENNLGACVTSREGVVGKSGSTYYICKAKSWVAATALEYDTYGKVCNTDGSIIDGEIILTNKYVCDARVFREANEQEIALNKGCVSYTENETSYLSGKYYICKSGNWTEVTVQYDTYGKTCYTDGTIVNGEIIPSNKYVCDASIFREANEQEIALNKGCVSYTENEEIRKLISEARDSIYACKNSLWAGSVGEHIVVYGPPLTDARDGKTYKTIVIGTQTWMAENLDYSDSTSYPSMQGRNWCYRNSLDSCSKYGRLYTWSAAMDSVGTFCTNGKGCGYGKTCSPTYPVRGICPSEWHLPSKAEIETLFTIVGIQQAGKMLKSTSGWRPSKGNGEDAFGFSALPAGQFEDNNFYMVGSEGNFWSSTERYDEVYRVRLYNYTDRADLETAYKSYGQPVRCIKD